MTLMTIKAACAAAFLMTAFTGPALADASQHNHQQKKPLLASQRSAEVEADSDDDDKESLRELEHENQHPHTNTRHRHKTKHHRHKGAPSLLKMQAKKTRTYPEIHEVESDFEKDFISDDNDFVLKQQVKRERNEETQDPAMLQAKYVQDEWRLEKLDYQHRREEENVKRAMLRKLKKSEAQAAWAKRVLLQQQAKYRVLAEEAETAKQEMLVAKAKSDSIQQKLQKTENMTAEVEREAMLLEEEHRTEAALVRKSSLLTRNLMDQYWEKLRGVNEAKAAMEDLRKKLAEYEAEVVQFGGKATSSDSSAVSVGGRAAEVSKGVAATTTEQEKGIKTIGKALGKVEKEEGVETEKNEERAKSAGLGKLTGLPKVLFLFPLLLPRP